MDTMIFREQRKLTGDHNQCQGCGCYFNSTHAFDKHRVGEWGSQKNPRANRRCLTEAEMLARGMVQNARGWWISEKSEFVR